MSFQQGLSGLNATSRNLEVIGNNIANANTYGAKSSRAEFADVFATALNGSVGSNIGIGVSLSTVAQQFTQGNITVTENPMDLAMNGAGFFQVSDGKSPTMYTRNGQFKLDREGFIVNNQGLKLMGYPADGTGVIQPGTATPLQLPTAGIKPAVTSKINLEMNLDSRAKTTTPASGAPITFNDATTYNNATSMTVFDEKGQDVALTYYFQKGETDASTNETTWNVFCTANGVPFPNDGATPPLPTTPTATMLFPANGSAPTSINGISPADAISVDIPASTNAQGAATLPISGVKLDLTDATQYGAAFGVTDVFQDGYAPGQLSGISVANNGVVTARYSNGQSKPAGQIEVANFRNTQGLQQVGGNMWNRSFQSGDPIVGVPGDGNLGKLQSGALEESNVDLTAELVNMVTAQRSYQANAQTIKTMDQVLQTLVNLR
jgi:flagellar hook protein FlgE